MTHHTQESIKCIWLHKRWNPYKIVKNRAELVCKLSRQAVEKPCNTLKQILGEEVYARDRSTNHCTLSLCLTCSCPFYFIQVHPQFWSDGPIEHAQKPSGTLFNELSVVDLARWQNGIHASRSRWGCWCRRTLCDSGVSKEPEWRPTSGSWSSTRRIDIGSEDRSGSPCGQWQWTGRRWTLQQPTVRRKSLWRGRTWGPSAKFSSSPAGTWCGWSKTRVPRHPIVLPSLRSMAVCRRRSTLERQRNP